MLSDAQSAVLEPLVAACRPKAKTPPQDLQRTLSASLWRHENGAKWRAIPEVLGLWWRAVQIFMRWARAGVWERLLGLVQESGIQLGMVFLDVTNVRAHQKAAGAAKKGGSASERDHRETLGRSRGGYGTKACVIADGAGHALASRITPGQAHELPYAMPLLDRLPGVPTWIVADRGYASHAFRQQIRAMGTIPGVPTKRNEAPVRCPDWIYANRNRVARLLTPLKEWQAIATHYEKTATSFSGFLCLAAALDYLK